MSRAHTTYEAQGPLAILTFDRPEAHNAMTWEMYDALVETCDRVEADPDRRVLILRGAGGKAFVAGTDISQFQTFRSRDDGVGYEHRIDQVLDRLERVMKPTIAEVQGIAAGGGCMIALTCDLRIATPESTFGVPIARTLGNCLSGSSYSRLLDLVGPGVLKELLFTGRFLDASEAHRVGLVNRVVAAADIDQSVRNLASDIAANAPLTIRATKEIVRRLAARRRLDLDDDRDLVEMCYASADFREGVSAFLAKRRPRWTGK